MLYRYHRGEVGLLETVGAMAVTGWYGVSLSQSKQAAVGVIGIPTVDAGANGPVKPCGTCPGAIARRLAGSVFDRGRQGAGLG